MTIGAVTSTKKLEVVRTGLLICALTLAPAAHAVDPPHNLTNPKGECANCHVPHTADGGSITKVAGNPNLCLSCHTTFSNPLADGDQALPGQTGDSHRWDSGPAGHVEAGATNTSTGEVRSGGTFSGRVEKKYTISITTPGNVGVATYSWSDDSGNEGSGTTGADVPLADALRLKFVDGSASPSFVASDTWSLYVRTDLRHPDPGTPFERQMALRIADKVRLPDSSFDMTFGKLICSVCHDQHKQTKTPFDPTAPSPYIDGAGEGRHYQRADNDTNQMCKICHSPRDVTSSSGGSHPVNVTIPSGFYQVPPTIPLDGNNKIQCMSCHGPHYMDSGGANGGSGDGYLLRQSIGNVCYECHTLADRTNGSHLNASSGALWPGGQYGTSFPAHAPNKRGLCVNCHWPHGWPDNDALSQDYPKLWVERYDEKDDQTDPSDAEDLCYTCHDGSPAQTAIRAEFLKTYRHPVNDSEQTAGRSVECRDCHNPHRARNDNVLAGTTGTSLTGSGVGPGTDIEQYELCFRCHGDTYNAARPFTSNKRLDFNTGASNSGYHPVTQAGRGQSANLAAGLRGSLTTSSTIKCTDCHNSEATGNAGAVDPTDPANPTRGPHGSAYTFILRAQFETSTAEQRPWNTNNAAVCFLCHNQTTLITRERRDGVRTNFFQNGESLHWLHLTDKGVTRSCLACHFDQHSNRTASNTTYRWRVSGVWFSADTPPANVKTHLVNFAPVAAGNSVAKPRWEINTETGQRNCNLTCHGKTHNESYGPSTDDETSHTY